MARLRVLSASEQVAARLRADLFRGKWTDWMPGEHRLVHELGVSHDTVKEALRLLEKESLLINQGAGKRRRIDPAKAANRRSSLRVHILLYEKSDQALEYMVELFHLLQEANHIVGFADKTLVDLRMDPRRVSNFVESTETDAWVVFAGSKEVLAWFAQQATPAFALFGRLTQVAMASTSPKKAEVYAEAVDHLVALGHRRIVHLVREERRKPVPGFLETLFLDRLETHGIKTGSYNLPDWEESPAGLHALLDSLFRHTPPTAILIDGPVLFTAVRSYLGDHLISVPGEVSLICTDPDPTFEWCHPKITYMDWESRPLVRRVAKWVDNISCGKHDRRKSSTKAKLILGGTTGPAPT